MEQANKLVESYIIQFKQELQHKITNLQNQPIQEDHMRDVAKLQLKDGMMDNSAKLDYISKDKMCELLEYIWEYPKFQFQTKQDAHLFNKKQEKKSGLEASTQQPKKIAPEDQCIARRSGDGDQCTRQKKKGSNYCGTHAKIEKNAKVDTPQINKMEVSAEEIHGIIYYIDAHNNVYNTEDILESRENPRIIAKAIKHPDNTYTIPDLF